jgi:hypothetical protein
MNLEIGHILHSRGSNLPDLVDFITTEMKSPTALWDQYVLH